MPEFDSSLLQSTLRAELREAWAAIAAAHARDGLYGFGVFTTDSAGYLMATAFSEAGLDAAVARTLASKRGQGRDPALQRQCLRWSPADSPLHEQCADLLPEANLLVHELDAEAQADDDDDFDAGDFDEDAGFDDIDVDGQDLDAAVAEVFDVVVQVLQDMDEEGLFGAGAERERLVLCVWKGDQSNLERYEFAKALNPPAVARRFGEELNAAARAFHRLSMPGEELPDDDVFE